MKIVLAAAIAAVGFAAIAGTAQAAPMNVCQWTGSDWACGDGNTFTQRYPAATGPNVAITPIKTFDPTYDGSAGASSQCYWAGDHWNCPGSYIYPKTYPWGTAIINGQYQRPMAPPASDVSVAQTPTQQ